MSEAVRTAVSQLAAGECIPAEQLRAAFEAMLAGESSEALNGAFLMGLRVRGETVDITRLDGGNPGLSAAEIASRLRESLGADRILWLDHGGLAGDDTDGHIDTLARFARPGHILYQAAGEDENHAELEAMRAELEALRDAHGQPYRLSPLPWPGEHRDAEGALLPASYANFLIINRAVLLPHYNVPQDADAGTVLARAFPDREIVGIDCRPLIRQYGSLHCVTMNLPA